MKSLIDIIEEAIRQTYVVEENGRKYVIKYYSVEPGLVKWFIIKSLSMPLQIYPYVTSPRDRMIREIDFFNRKPGNVNTPRIIDIDWNNYSIKREYIKGEIFRANMPHLKYIELAQTLAKIHKARYALGDSKYTNFIVTDHDEIYIIDAEQAIETNNEIHYSWDLIIFTVTILYSYGFLKDIEHLYSRLRLFYDSYMDYHNVDPVSNIINKVRLRTIFSILVPLPYNVQLINMLKEITSK